jgi:opacity protein-like surface antigen
MRPSDAVARVLLGLARALVSFPLLLFLPFVLCPPSAAAYEEEEPWVAGAPSGTPDFRFKQPWVIIGMRGGWAINRTDSQIHDFLNEHLTLNQSDFGGGDFYSDFDGPAFALDVGVRATSWMDVVFGFEVSGRSKTSHFRQFVEQNGDDIKQKTTLTQVPLTASLKLYPIGRGRQLGKYAWVRSFAVPYVGGGLGATWYKLKQKGDFVDFTDLSIFEAELESDAWGFAKHVFMGIDFKITRNFGAVLEGRYYWAEASVKDDFKGFDRIDLDGARIMAGFNFRI